MQLLRLLVMMTLLVTACRQNNQPVPAPFTPAATPPPPPPALTAIYSFPAQPFRPGTVNIRVLFNSMKSFRQATVVSGAGFNTECIVCQPVEAYKGHLLFARQLEIFFDSTIYHPQPLTTAPPVRPLRRFSTSGEPGNITRFRFSLGTGIIRYHKQACNDSELDELVLHYANGPATLNNLVNAAFFEYDLDGNGTNEQYIISVYNCSQEITVYQLRPSTGAATTM